MKNKGFTLIELMVSVVAFAIVFATVTGVLVTSIRYQKYNLMHNRLINETGYAMEYMSRSLRMAVKDVAGNCVGTAGKSYKVLSGKVQFLNYRGECESFSWDMGTNQIVVNTPSLVNVPLTSTGFQVINFALNVFGDSSDTLQPRVVLYLELKGKSLPTNPVIKMETTVSQRNLDI